MSCQKTNPVPPRSIRRTRRTAHVTGSSPADVPFPFRWDIAHRHHLGGLLEGAQAITCPRFTHRLLDGCARTVAASGEADLVFVGRSPESLHDLLLGLLTDTSWHRRLTLLQFSTGYWTTSAERRRHPRSLAAFRAYLDSVGLSPAKLTVRERPVAFVDLLNTGHTFHQFLLLLRDWATEERADWPAMQRKIKVVGIVRPDAPSPIRIWKRRPKPWRWRDDAPWISEVLERGSLREVVMDRDLWSYLADYQDKTTRSYIPERWGSAEITQPDRAESYLKALRLAHQLNQQGHMHRTRLRFASLLAAQREMQHDWLRDLVHELRSGAGQYRRSAASGAACAAGGNHGEDHAHDKVGSR